MVVLFLLMSGVMVWELEISTCREVFERATGGILKDGQHFLAVRALDQGRSEGPGRRRLLVVAKPS